MRRIDHSGVRRRAILIAALAVVIAIVSACGPGAPGATPPSVGTSPAPASVGPSGSSKSGDGY